MERPNSPDSPVALVHNALISVLGLSLEAVSTYLSYVYVIFKATKRNTPSTTMITAFAVLFSTGDRRLSDAIFNARYPLSLVTSKCLLT